TDHTIGQGTERSYSTATTEGTSTSSADTVTWNHWEEGSETKPLSGATSTVATALGHISVEDSKRWSQTLAGQTILAGAGAGAGAICSPGVLLAIVCGAETYFVGTVLLDGAQSLLTSATSN